MTISSSTVLSSSMIAQVRRGISLVPTSMPVARSWYAMKTLSIMNMAPPRSQLSRLRPTMAVSRTSPRISTSLVPMSLTKALSSPSAAAIARASRSSTSSSCIIQAMSRSTSMVRRLCQSAGVQPGTPIPISSLPSCRRASVCSCV